MKIASWRSFTSSRIRFLWRYSNQPHLYYYRQGITIREVTSRAFYSMALVINTTTRLCGKWQRLRCNALNSRGGIGRPWMKFAMSLTKPWYGRPATMAEQNQLQKNNSFGPLLISTPDEHWAWSKRLPMYCMDAYSQLMWNTNNYQFRWGLVHISFSLWHPQIHRYLCKDHSCN
jgi:hypothetical protein